MGIRSRFPALDTLFFTVSSVISFTSSNYCYKFCYFQTVISQLQCNVTTVYMYIHIHIHVFLYTCTYYVMVIQKDSIRYRDVRYKDQPLPPNSKRIVTSSVNLSSTTPSGSLSSQTTSTSAHPSKPHSAQHTALSQPALSSHSALSCQPDLS